MTPRPIALARYPDDPATLAFAGVIAQSLQADRRPLIRGMDEGVFTSLISEYFPGLEYQNGSTDHTPATGPLFHMDEFDDLLELLMAHRASGTRQEAWLAHAIATAAMGENHLWQDMGLPNRQILSQLLNTYFPTLAARNKGDMKWKKFFYRQLCEGAGIPICKSPHCADCCDYRVCFGPEGAE